MTCDEPLFLGPLRTVTIDDRWILTHAIWNGYQETGVRDLKDTDSVTGRPHFDLIQHGWGSLDRAEEIIVKGLRKGWSPFRVSCAMDRIKK